MKLLMAVLFVTGSTIAAAQRPEYASPKAQNTPAMNTPTAGSAIPEVHVDWQCWILPDPESFSPGKKIRPRWDPRVCHLEAILHTHHLEQKVVGMELQRADVEIYEQQYVLGNLTDQTQLFVIEQPATKGWTFESDPPPFRVAGKMAYFQAYVQPGEEVRLHVGMRHETPLKPKLLKAAARN